MGESVKLPEYLAKIEYRNPGDDPNDPGLFQWSHNTDVGFFEFIRSKPEMVEMMGKMMRLSVELEKETFHQDFVYPFEEKLGGDLSSDDEVVLVDIGGGFGQVLDGVRKNCPDLKGRLVLQDLPETVKGHVQVENMDVVGHDFFTPQPVKGLLATSSRQIWFAG